jgi:hypothetical protein
MYRLLPQVAAYFDLPTDITYYPHQITSLLMHYMRTKHAHDWVTEIQTIFQSFILLHTHKLPAGYFTIRSFYFLLKNDPHMNLEDCQMLFAVIYPCLVNDG